MTPSARRALTLLLLQLMSRRLSKPGTKMSSVLELLFTGQAIVFRIIPTVLELGFILLTEI